MPRSRSGDGFAPVFRKGITKKELEQGGGNRGDQVYLRTGDTLPVQFLQTPDEFVVFQEHQWQEDGRWHFVPCLGDNCPLCDDESDSRSNRRYQWAANIYNVKEKKVQILKGGKDLGGRVFFRYERKPAMFTKRVLEITKFATSPISFEVGMGEDKPTATANLKLFDLEEWLDKQASEYFGDLKTVGPSSLDEPEPGDECPECGMELDEDGECTNPECEWDPSATDDVAEVCPECDEPLGEDGECENPECDAYEEPEEEAEPEPKPRRAAGKKQAPRRRPARR